MYSEENRIIKFRLSIDIAAKPNNFFSSLKKKSELRFLAMKQSIQLMRGNMYGVKK